MNNFKFYVDYANCYSREGKYSYWTLEDCYKYALQYAKECSSRKVYGGGVILIYVNEDGYDSLVGLVHVDTKFSGKRHSDGTAIPSEDGSIEIITDFSPYDSKYAEELETLWNSFSKED